jgi:t-SNARE complex subunit (syntaxin)
VSELSGKVGVLEVGRKYISQVFQRRSMYHGRQHLGKASVNKTTCKTVILLTLTIITFVVILLLVFADIFAVAIMGIVSVTNSRYARRTLF